MKDVGNTVDFKGNDGTRRCTTDRKRLLTSEILELAGVSRTTANNYVTPDLLTPLRTSEAANADYMWTFQQADVVRSLKLLTQTGLKVGRISEIFGRDSAALNELLFDVNIEQMRQARRNLKGNVVNDTRLEDAEAVGIRTRPYFRYIPQRWMALLPVRPEGASILPGGDGYVRHAVELLLLSRIVGWCSVGSVGSLASAEARVLEEGLMHDPSEIAWWVSAPLASPPMPSITGDMVIDGGCYRSVRPDEFDPGCAKDDCKHCSRFGFYPEESDLLRWKDLAEQYPDAEARTILMEDLTTPYPSGMWMGATHEHFEGKSSSEPGGPSSNGKRTWTVRPRLMPHKVTLPLGMSACVLPASVYLCLQYAEGEQESAFRQMLTLSSTLEKYEMTEHDELNLVEQRLGRNRREQWSSKGPFIEPFGRPRAECDPGFEHWFHDAAPSDIRALRVPLACALWPQDGVCMIADTLPSSDVNAEPRFEIQMLVDASRVPVVIERLSAE